MKLNFEKFSQQGKEFMELLSTNLNRTAKQSESILINVLNAMRSHLTGEETIHLLSGLPMFLKAAYVDGWQYYPYEKRTRSAEEFVVEVMKTDRAGDHNFQNWSQGVDMIRRVIRTLSQFASEDKKDLGSLLPSHLRVFFLNHETINNPKVVSDKVQRKIALAS